MTRSGRTHGPKMHAGGVESLLLALCLCGVLSACASGTRVKCDGRLEPINPPAAHQKPGPAAAPAAPSRTTAAKESR
jgi:hypothetical protein